MNSWSASWKFMSTRMEKNPSFTNQYSRDYMPLRDGLWNWWRETSVLLWRTLDRLSCFICLLVHGCWSTNCMYGTLTTGPIYANIWSSIQKKLLQNIVSGIELVEQITFLLLAMIGYAFCTSFFLVTLAWLVFEYFIMLKTFKSCFRVGLGFMPWYWQKSPVVLCHIRTISRYQVCFNHLSKNEWKLHNPVAFSGWKRKTWFLVMLCGHGLCQKYASLT